MLDLTRGSQAARAGSLTLQPSTTYSGKPHLKAATGVHRGEHHGEALSRLLLGSRSGYVSYKWRKRLVSTPAQPDLIWSTLALRKPSGQEAASSSRRGEQSVGITVRGRRILMRQTARLRVGA